MAAYFQWISDDHFDASSDFVVKESRGVNLLTGVFFLILGVALVSMTWYGLFMIIPALAVIGRGVRNTVVIIINKDGFYYYGVLLTDWDHFISEDFIDDGPAMPRSMGKDQFYLLIKYYKEGQLGYYGRKIRLTDSQDKSEEEIIAAVKFYYKQHVKVDQ